MRKVLFLFGELNDHDVEWIIEAGRKVHLSAGDVLIREAVPADNLYIILEGLFKVFVSSMEDKEISRINAGEVVGEISFVDDRPPAATVEALTDSVLLSLPRAEIVEKLKQDTAFAARFYRALAISLSYRLRLSNKSSADDENDFGDKLDSNVLDNLYLAGVRFDRLVKRLIGH